MTKKEQINSLFADAFQDIIDNMLNTHNHNDVYPRLTEELKWGPNEGLEGSIFWTVNDHIREL